MERNIISQARARLLLDSKPSAAFLATCVMQLKVIPSDCKTLQTDGTHLWYNPEFCASLPEEELIGAVAHEGLHCAYLHMFRRGSRDPEGYNIAADHVINLQLTDWGYKLPKGVYCDPQYRGMSVEKVYTKMVGNKPPEPSSGQKPNQSGKPSAGGGQQAGGKPDKNGKPEPGKQAGAGSPQTSGKTDAKPEGGKPEPSGKGGSRSDTDAGQGGQVPQAKPDILPNCPTGEFVDPPPVVQGKDAHGDPTPPPLTAEDWSIIAEQAAMAARAAGSLPGELSSFMQASRTQTADWAEELRQYITQSITEESTFSKPKRRLISSGITLPGRRKEAVGELVVFVDFSGSTSGRMREVFANELGDIINEVQPEKTWLVYVDTKVSKVECFEKGDEFEIKAVQGGGGTLFQPAFDWIEREDIHPLAAIYLTDLGCFDRATEPDYPVIWAKPNWITATPPFDGPVVELDVR